MQIDCLSTATTFLCDKALNCFKAVYDTQTRDCHIKGTGDLDWQPNGRFDVIQAEQINIARCPYPETSYTYDGKTFKVCRDTDLRGETVETIWRTTLENCAWRCSNRGNCMQAVFDSTLSVCHIKADAKSNTLIWSTDKRFDVIRREVAVNPAADGAWSDLIRLPVIPVAAYVVPEFPSSSRLMVFSSWGADAFGGAGGRTQFADYNFNSGAVSARTIANTQHDMFCPGISALEDGRILIQGGSDAQKNSFYDPSTNTFTRAPDLIMARGYQTGATLSDGRVFTIGGAYSGPRKGKDGEVYDPKSNSWKALPGAKNGPLLTTDHEGIWREDNHAWLFAWRNGSIFQAGPSKAMNWYSANGNGAQLPAGTRDVDDAMCGTWVMYEPGKILTAGGAPDYTNSNANNRAHLISIGEYGQPATVERAPDMAYARGFSNAVVLPDGTVLVTGGQPRSLVFTDTDGILQAELFNPATKSWKTLAAEAVPRNYHSVSILLPDARVFSGGGGLCYTAGGVGRSTVNCNKLVDHADGQTFSPPYLFNPDGSEATRPTISALSSTRVKVGGQLKISSSTKNPKIVLIRIGTVTHSVNSDQRRIPLENVVCSGTEHTATLPNDSGVLIPGHYYLFLINEAGVPSIARTVQVTIS
ncbi:hypothetical protein N0V86_008472 [Didymella sp. IMI 355093]|nr:hypothetical protein N0V86_008472 [Didymella sp. IMI 355093]